MTTGRVLHWIPGVDLRNKYEGLAAIAKKRVGVDVRDLKPGDFVMFINNSWTQIALYAAHNVVLYHRAWDGARLNPKALMTLPNFVRGQDIGYARALDAVIRKEFATSYPRLGKTT